ncbi:Gfo/Idh/MocA family protein [Paenibacillus physcomitrellae]|uniref:Deoxyfructose oxidoreductase n=1 Tax=Paenibacillus physcomitrellae TaxID=1619311 RepID=A0ABQ1GBA2_9BACL|nr:Gfo/Idh/MocA family oxidoreductase [Paenibacillus physcomitrellae]GGA40291.1 deoxyfructose oxidoreductase [Paenibacillus physcomitrellae]
MRKLRWGIMSTASVARDSVIPAIRESETGVVSAIASRDIRKSGQTAEGIGGAVRAYGNYEDLLEDPEIDAVYIPLPNHLHAKWSIAALKAGKHVLCEKPGALSAIQFEKVLSAAESTGKHYAEALMYRYHPQFKEVKQRIRKGAIGELRLIRACFTCNSADSQGNIRFREEWGGGALYDLAEYPLSAARWLTGEEPEAVTVHASYSEAHGGVDMSASGLVEFPGGVSLLFDCGLWAEERRCLEIVGSEGRIELPHAFSGKEQSGYFLYKGRETTEARERPLNAYVLEIDHFGQVVLEGRQPDFTASDALKNLRLLDACRQSALQKRRIKLETGRETRKPQALRTKTSLGLVSKKMK